MQETDGFAQLGKYLHPLLVSQLRTFGLILEELLKIAAFHQLVHNAPMKNVFAVAKNLHNICVS